MCTGQPVVTVFVAGITVRTVLITRALDSNDVMADNDRVVGNITSINMLVTLPPNTINRHLKKSEKKVHT